MRLSETGQQVEILNGKYCTDALKDAEEILVKEGMERGIALTYIANEIPEIIKISERHINLKYKDGNIIHLEKSDDGYLRMVVNHSNALAYNRITNQVSTTADKANRLIP